MDLIESAPKRLYKTSNGVEVRLSLIKRDAKTGSNSNLTYYYAVYIQDKEDLKWKVGTNSRLYGEKKDIIICGSREEAVKIAGAINLFIDSLISNI